VNLELYEFMIIARHIKLTHSESHKYTSLTKSESDMKVKFSHQIFQSDCVVATHLPLLMHCFNFKENTTRDQTLTPVNQQPTWPKWYLSSRFIHKPSCM